MEDSAGMAIREVGAFANAIRTLSILTTHHKRLHPEWVKHTTLLPGWYQAFETANRSRWRSFLWACRLFWASRHFDAVVTGAEHIGAMFAVLQFLFRSSGRRRTHVMIDFPWAASPGKLSLLFKRLQWKIIAQAVDSVFAHASPEEADRFTTVLGVRPGLFQYVPFHYWVGDPLPTVADGDYVFAGGDRRDYETLLRAVQGAPYRVIICARDRAYFTGRTIPPNVEIVTVSPERFDELLAGAALVVVPLPQGDIHTGGHTVILTALALGKPVVVAGTAEYRHYVQQERTGLLVPPGDGQALRMAMDRVLGDREFARLLSCEALSAAREFSPERFFARVFAAVEEAEESRRKRCRSKPQ